MNEIQAREILGTSGSASYKELKAAYRRMILLVHPDKAEKDDLSQQRAKEASSRINQAWEYLDAREKQGVLGDIDQESSPRQGQQSGRATYAHECTICGFAPAVKISAPIIISFIYFVRGGKYEASACRSCGLTMSRMALRESLIKGWWGLGIFMMPHAVYRYFVNVKALSKIDFPAFRDPSVVTPSQFPLQVPKSPLKEPIPLIASAVAIIGILAILFGGANNSSNSTPSFYFGEVGSCFKQVTTSTGNQLEMVDCGDAAATLKSIYVSASGDVGCPMNTLYTTRAHMPDGTFETACLVSIR
jgi:hypothetical protein